MYANQRRKYVCPVLTIDFVSLPVGVFIYIQTKTLKLHSNPDLVKGSRDKLIIK